MVPNRILLEASSEMLGHVLDHLLREKCGAQLAMEAVQVGTIDAVHVAELLPIHLAGIGLLFAVDAFVYNQMAGHGEPLAANFTKIKFFTCVDSHMAY